MDENLDLDRRVLRQLLYTGILNIGRSDLRDTISLNATKLYGTSNTGLASDRECRQLLGNCFSSADTCMYLDMVGLFGYLAPMYSSGSLDLKMFNDPERIAPLHEYTERSLAYLSGRQYVEIPDEATRVVGTFIESIAPKLSQGVQDLAYKQKNAVYYSDYYLRLTHEDTTDIFIGHAHTNPTSGMLLNVRVESGALNFKMNKGFLSGELDKHFVYRRLREIMALEAWLYMLETGECLDLREVKKDLASHVIMGEACLQGALSIKEVVTKGKTNTIYYCLELHYYQ